MKNSEAIEAVENAIRSLGIQDTFAELVDPMIASGKLLNEFPELQEVNDKLYRAEITVEIWCKEWLSHVEAYKRLQAVKKLEKFILE